MKTIDSNGARIAYAPVSDEIVEALGRETEFARGLPNEAFTSQAFLDLENQYVFSRSWVFAGPASDLPDCGDVKPVEVAGRSLFMARGQDGQIRVFQNVCPHRGTRLVTEVMRRTSVLTCPYHAWSYDLDGNLRGRPHYHGPDKHDRGNNGGNDQVCLFTVRSATGHDWVFVNLDGNATIVTDITERKRAEEKLAEKEAQLRLALDNMPGGMMLADQDGNYVLFNARYSELCGFPGSLLEVGGSMLDEVRYQAERGDFGPGDADGLIEEVIAVYQRGEAVSFERAIAGSGRTLEISVAPTPEGGHVSILTDITERKRAEEALLKAKQRAEEAGKLVAEKNRMLESLSSQLSKYLSPQVYASIFAGEQSVEIASQRKKLTVFFSDIADFMGTTDALESEELTNLLNHYLTEMSTIALDHGATIDKYVGDSIIAFFGDPETRGVKEDAKACVTMAIAMQRRMRELRSEWLDMGLERPFELRIGINTGFCTVGNFGSADRMDYTIIGNEVNLAARLESLAQVGGILLAHETHALVKDTVMAEEGDTLTVKGFAKPVRTYGVVGLYDDLAEQGRIIRKQQDGLALEIDRGKLNKKAKAEAIKAIKDVLSQLEG